MDIKITKATRDDMPGVLSLIKELAVYEKEPDAVKITVDSLLEHGFGSNPLFTCFVAKENDSLIGMALCYYRFSTWDGKSLHLEDLIVKESYRGQGIGQRLYDQIMLFGFENKVKRVEWVVLDWNKTAIEFYKRSNSRFLKDWYLVQMDEERLHAYIDTIKNQTGS